MASDISFILQPLTSLRLTRAAANKTADSPSPAASEPPAPSRSSSPARASLPARGRVNVVGVSETAAPVRVPEGSGGAAQHAASSRADWIDRPHARSEVPSEKPPHAAEDASGIGDEERTSAAEVRRARSFWFPPT